MGIAFGAPAGLLIRVGRQRPRLATGTALVLMIVFASDLGRQLAFDVVNWIGWSLRRNLVPWSFSGDQISVTVIIFGACVADLAMYITRTKEFHHGGSKSRH